MSIAFHKRNSVEAYSREFRPGSKRGEGCRGSLYHISFFIALQSEGAPFSAARIAIFDPNSRFFPLPPQKLLSAFGRKKDPWREISTFAQNRGRGRFPILKWREILREYGAHPLSHSGKYKCTWKVSLLPLHKAGILNPPSPPCSRLHTRVMFPPVEWELLHYAILPPHPPTHHHVQYM